MRERRTLRETASHLSATSAPLAVIAGIAVASFLVGLVGAVVAERFGPSVLFVLPLVGLAAGIVFDRIALAPNLVVLVVPVGLVALPGGYEVVQVTAAAVVGLVVLRRLAAGRAPLVVPGVLWWGLVVAAIAVVGLTVAPDVDAAVRQVIGIVLSLLLVSAVATACTSIADVRRVMSTLAAVGLVVSGIGLSSLGSLEAVNSGQTVNNRARGTFTEPNQFGIFCALVVFVSLGLLLSARTPRQRLLPIASGLTALLALMVALSRGSWIGAVVGLGLLLFLLPSARRQLALASLPLVVIGLLVVTLQPDRPELQVVQDRIGTFGDVTGNPYDNRPAIWKEARRQVREQPLLGQGPGQFPYVSQRAAEASTVAAFHAHNVLLTVAAELGMPAAGLVVGFTLSMLALARRTVRTLSDPGHRALAASLAAALAVVVGQGLVDFTLRNAVIISLLSVLLGLLLAVSRLRDEPVADPAVTSARQAVGALS